MQQRSCRDAIKLFGTKIRIPITVCSPPDSFPVLSQDERNESIDKKRHQFEESEFLPGAGVGDDFFSTGNENPKTSSIEEESSKSSESLPEKDGSDVTNPLEKPKLKKPDKIIPCPRCKSMDTKFCYYNNYNVNQPRHFCKACQRYWTAGGSMRNVPVGAGRRKNKNSASYYRYVTLSEALQPTTNSNSTKTYARVLNFGMDTPISDSIASELKHADKKDLKRTRDTFLHQLEEKHDHKVGENADECRSSVKGFSSAGEGRPQELNVPSDNGFSPQISYQGVHWPYSWSPIFPAGGYQVPLYHPPYWPLVSSTASNQKGGGLKYKEEAKQDKSENDAVLNGCIVVPKILRFDDPDDAAKSSIWRTLGINGDSCHREGFFKGLQPKGEHKDRPLETYPALLANPAALSRSLDFHESS